MLQNAGVHEYFCAAWTLRRERGEAHSSWGQREQPVSQPPDRGEPWLGPVDHCGQGCLSWTQQHHIHKRFQRGSYIYTEPTEWNNGQKRGWVTMVISTSWAWLRVQVTVGLDKLRWRRSHCLRLDRVQGVECSSGFCKARASHQVKRVSLYKYA